MQNRKKSARTGCKSKSALQLSRARNAVPRATVPLILHRRQSTKRQLRSRFAPVNCDGWFEVRVVLEGYGQLLDVFLVVDRRSHAMEPRRPFRFGQIGERSDALGYAGNDRLLGIEGVEVPQVGSKNRVARCILFGADTVTLLICPYELCEAVAVLLIRPSQPRHGLLAARRQWGRAGGRTGF
eukprot:SAG31_NODE_10901_length_1085_cov_1.668357_2_plen_182_part_01